MGKELVLFEAGELVLDVKVTPDQDTVWLTQEQIKGLCSE